jgi:predicted Zn-dependent protease with MMP-like domain
VPYHVSKAHFEELVEKALKSLPPQFAEFLQEVPLEVRDRATQREMRDARVRPDGLLLGLYHGRPRTIRSVMDSGAMPDVIYIFQDAIEQCCHTEDELVEQVRTTVLHEIGHHFGMNEEDLEKLGYG